MSSVYVLHGLRPWLIQRISAVYMALFVVYIVVTLAMAGDTGYQQWHDWLFHPVNVVAVGLFVIALLLHAWIGMRDIILDYVHNTLLRMVAFTLVIVVLISSGLWSAKLLLLSVAM
ncbi:MAG: succinate dehydrogenase, hydrophobic membrane anchor protein [Thiotrichales bacterium]|nr:MAG: succinate dehydrogenase, hydrophobic membrane anchor protein [Thiotrichales bacterium]